MKKIFAIAKWEYLEKIKTRAFILSLIISPLLIISFSLLPSFFVSRGETSTRAVGILDETGLFFENLKKDLSSIKLENGQPAYVVVNLYNGEDFSSSKTSADDQIIKEKIDGYLLISGNSMESAKAEYRSKNIPPFGELKNFESKINSIRVNRKLVEEGINPEIMNYISREITINNILVEEKGKERKSDFGVMFFSSFIFIILLMMMVIYSGQMLVRSLVEEKSNRIIEVLISSSRPEELLAGKIIGLSALGLTQILIWLLIGVGLAGSALVTPDAFKNVLPVLVYFILGFVLFTAIFVGIGSIITTEQEAQQITGYLSLIIMFPVVIAIPAMQNPDTTFMQVLSYFPLTTPTLMILKYNITAVPLWEFGITVLILILSIFITIKVTSKIFRIGILSYGKRPTSKELMSWLKEK
ncbi:MAG: ABC transporter permease [Ignavibacteriaceae bacterium]|nr:ABC transporter permease [Ignavibacteriaceae bacterium]